MRKITHLFASREWHSYVRCVDNGLDASMSVSNAWRLHEPLKSNHPSMWNWIHWIAYPVCPDVVAAITLNFASGAKGSCFLTYWNCQNLWSPVPITRFHLSVWILYSNKTHAALVYPLNVQVMQDITLKDVSLTTLSTSSLHSPIDVWCCPWGFILVHKIVFSSWNSRYWGYIKTSNKLKSTRGGTGQCLMHPQCAIQ